MAQIMPTRLVGLAPQRYRRIHSPRTYLYDLPHQVHHLEQMVAGVGAGAG